MGAMEKRVNASTIIETKHSEEQRSAFFYYLASAHVALSMFGVFLSKEFVPHLRHLRDIGTITPEQNLLLTQLLDYIGNNPDGLAYAGAMAMMIDMFFIPTISEVNLPSNIRKTLEFFRWIIPFLLLTIVAVYNIDVESLQILPGSFGNPHPGDIFAGAYGMLAGVLLYTLYRATIAKGFEKGFRWVSEQKKKLLTD